MWVCRDVKAAVEPNSMKDWGKCGVSYLRYFPVCFCATYYTQPMNCTLCFHVDDTL